METLENILAYAFPRQEPLTPFSWHYPHDGMTHLLLVSKAFRELCLPLLLHTVIVARPEALAILFHSETGLLVAGQEGRRNWGYVRELCLVDKLGFPLDTGYADDTDGLVPLTVPDHRGLDELCFLKPVELDANEMDDASYAYHKDQIELHHRRTQWLKANRRAAVLPGLLERHAHDLERWPTHTSPDFEEYLLTNGGYQQGLVNYAREEDDRLRAEFLRTVILNTAPRLIRQPKPYFPSIPWRRSSGYSARWPDYAGTATLVIHDERGKEWLYDYAIYPGWIKVAHVHLVGFDLKRVTEFVRRIEEGIAAGTDGRRWTVEGSNGTILRFGGEEA